MNRRRTLLQPPRCSLGHALRVRRRSFDPRRHVLRLRSRDDRLSLEAAVTPCFIAVNGNHPMTPADDSYVSAWFLRLPRLAERAGVAVDELRRLMLANR